MARLGDLGRTKQIVALAIVVTTQIFLTIVPIGGILDPTMRKIEKYLLGWTFLDYLRVVSFYNILHRPKRVSLLEGATHIIRNYPTENNRLGQ
jgi:hypothetical protein